MIELSQSDFLLAQALFESSSYGALAAGTLEGSHPGQVFVDRKTSPQLGLVCTRVGYYFLAGGASPSTAGQLAKLFTEGLIPRQLEASQNPEFLLFYHPDDWAKPLVEHLSERKPLVIHKTRHTFPSGAQNRLEGWRARLPTGITAHPIREQLLADHPELAEAATLFFGSSAAFLQRSFGICLLDGGSLASVCRAVFVGKGEAEIDVYTAEPYRGRGLAFLAASAFIEASIQRGLHPVWGCWPENLPSLALAHRLGFLPAPDQPACLWVEEPEWKNRTED